MIAGDEDGQAVLAVADRYTPRVRSAWTDAIELTRALTPVARVEAAIAAGRLGLALDEIPWDEVAVPLWRGQLLGALRDTVDAAGVTTGTFLGAPPLRPPGPGGGGGGGPRGRRPNFSFEVTSPRVLRFLQDYGANLVTELDTSSRRALRTTLVEMSRLGWGPRTSAREIVGQIGLTERLAQAVVRYRAQLIDAGIEGAELARRVAAKRQFLLRYRANLIARTEPKLAAAAAQDLAWQQAISEGRIDPQVAVVLWSTARDEMVCPICRPMNGQERRIGEPFETGDGRSALVPTDTHPQCRCVRTLRAAGTRARGSLGDVVAELRRRERDAA